MSSSWWAPRPSTPTINRSFSNGSAPGSPMRLPRIERVPSLDAVERSNHNDSGHGKSTFQIIKELKASNAKLSAKTADMEAEFMNRVTEMQNQFSNKENDLKDSLKAKDNKLKSLETRIKTTENRIREKDSQLSELKEETTFQRHTIADLKNQLYQLQHEIEDAEYDKRDGVDRWSAEKKEMEYKMEQLRNQLACISNGPVSNGPVSNDSDRQYVRQNRKSLEETVEELDETKKRLHDTQSILANLQNEAKRLRKEHEEREEELVVKIRSFDGENSTVQDLKKDLEDREQRVNELIGEVKKYSTQLAELTMELEEVKANSHSQNKYREEEAEDLRVLNQSLKEEIDRLKSDTEEMGHDLDEKDELVMQKNNEINDLQRDFLLVSKELEGSKDTVVSKDESRVEKVIEQLNLSRSENQKLRSEVNSTTRKHSELINRLQKEVQVLTLERDNLSSKLVDAKATQDQALCSTENKRKQDESRTEKRLREIVANSAKERSELESEFEKRLTRAEQECEQKNSKIKSQAQGTKQAQMMQNEWKEQASQIQILRQEAENNAREQYALSNEIQKLREKVRIFESKKAGNDRAKKQLREAQIALVALDDEKTLSDRQHKDTILALERQIKRLESEHEAKIQDTESEPTQIKHQFSNTNLSEHITEIGKLKAELREKDSLIKAERSKALLNAEAGPVDESAHEELRVSRDKIQELQTSLSNSQIERFGMQKKLKEKMDDRDTTISALVKSSVSQEQKVAVMKTEILNLRSELEQSTLSSGSESVRMNRNTNYIEEIQNLKNQAKNQKEVEIDVIQQVESLRNKLEGVRKENLSLNNFIATTSSSNMQDHHEKLQERDSAIATLVKQSMSLEEQMSNLKAENSTLKMENGAFATGAKKNSGPSWAEVRRLQQESEIFAGQIIEQDEEMEALRTTADERTMHILELEKDLASVKRKAVSHDRDMGRFEDMQAELDEIQEANDTHRSEIRDLRKQLRESKTHTNEFLDLRAELEQAQYAMEEMRHNLAFSTEEGMKLQNEIEEAFESKEDIEYKLNQQIDSMRRQRNGVISALEEKIKEKDDTIEELCSNERTVELEMEIEQLSKKLFEKADMLEEYHALNNQLQKKLDENVGAQRQKELERKKEVLEKEVDKLRNMLLSTELDRANIEAIKGQLKSSNEDKQVIEDRIVENYERKLSLLKLDKDVTIDNLRKELVESKTENLESSDSLRKELVNLEQESTDVRYELEAKLHLKNTKIHGLEQTLEAQEQLVENMRAEMDQLQSTMERTSLSRRAEIEEMQQEMIDTSSRAQKQEREITSLKMAVEESRLERQTEVSKLKGRLDSMARSNHFTDSKVISNTRLDNVKERLENLKWRNTSLQEENLKLRNRLERVEKECEVARAENDNASESKVEVIQLRERVQELEEMRKSNKIAVESIALQHKKPPQPEPNGGRWNNKTTPSPRHRTMKTNSSSRKSPTSALRFLKRRNSSKEVTNSESKRSSTSNDDSNSTSSKNTF